MGSTVTRSILKPKLERLQARERNIWEHLADVDTERSYPLNVAEVKRLAGIAGLSEAALAKRLDVHVKTLRNRWLAGKPVYRSNIVRLAEVLKTNWLKLAVGASFAEEIAAVPITIDLNITGTTQRRDGIHGEIAQSLNTALRDLKVEIRSMRSEVSTEQTFVEVNVFMFKAHAEDGRLCWGVLIPRACADPYLKSETSFQFSQLQNFGRVIVGSVWEHGMIPSFIIAIIAEVFQTSFIDYWHKCMSEFAHLKPDPGVVIPVDAIDFREQE